MTQPVSNSLYGTAVGTASTNAFLTVFETRNPTVNDINYPVQKRWLNLSNNNEWVLTGFTSSPVTLLANWEKIASGTSTAETLTGNSGGAVGPDTNNNINVRGDGTTINVIGNPGSNTLTINAIPQPGDPTVEVTGTTQAISVNTNYIANNVGLVTFTLPATAVQGDHFRIIGKGAGGWKVNVQTNQAIQIDSIVTTTSTGSLASTNQWDSIYVFCITSGASTLWSVLDSMGNITTV